MLLPSGLRHPCAPGLREDCGAQEVVGLNVGDYLLEFGLPRVYGRGAGQEAPVPLPEVARGIISGVSGAMKGGKWRQERMRDHRAFKVVAALGFPALAVPGLAGVRRPAACYPSAP